MDLVIEQIGQVVAVVLASVKLAEWLATRTAKLIAWAKKKSLRYEF